METREFIRHKPRLNSLRIHKNKLKKIAADEAKDVLPIRQISYESLVVRYDQMQQKKITYNDMNASRDNTSSFFANTSSNSIKNDIINPKGDIKSTELLRVITETNKDKANELETVDPVSLNPTVGMSNDVTEPLALTDIEAGFQAADNLFQQSTMFEVMNNRVNTPSSGSDMNENLMMKDVETDGAFVEVKLFKNKQIIILETDVVDDPKSDISAKDNTGKPKRRAAVPNTPVVDINTMREPSKNIPEVPQHGNDFSNGESTATVNVSNLSSISENVHTEKTPSLAIMESTEINNHKESNIVKEIPKKESKRRRRVPNKKTIMNPNDTKNKDTKANDIAIVSNHKSTEIVDTFNKNDKISEMKSEQVENINNDYSSITKTVILTDTSNLEIDKVDHEILQKVMPMAEPTDLKVTTTPDTPPNSPPDSPQETSHTEKSASTAIMKSTEEINTNNESNIIEKINKKESKRRRRVPNKKAIMNPHDTNNKDTDANDMVLVSTQKSTEIVDAVNKNDEISEMQSEHVVRRNNDYSLMTKTVIITDTTNLETDQVDLKKIQEVTPLTDTIDPKVITSPIINGSYLTNSSPSGANVLDRPQQNFHTEKTSSTSILESVEPNDSVSDIVKEINKNNAKQRRRVPSKKARKNPTNTNNKDTEANGMAEVSNQNSSETVDAVYKNEEISEMQSEEVEHKNNDFRFLTKTAIITDTSNLETDNLDLETLQKMTPMADTTDPKVITSPIINGFHLTNPGRSGAKVLGSPGENSNTEEAPSSGITESTEIINSISVSNIVKDINKTESKRRPQVPNKKAIQSQNGTNKKGNTSMSTQNSDTLKVVKNRKRLSVPNERDSPGENSQAEETPSTTIKESTEQINSNSVTNIVKKLNKTKRRPQEPNKKAIQTPDDTHDIGDTNMSTKNDDSLKIGKNRKRPQVPSKTNKLSDGNHQTKSSDHTLNDKSADLDSSVKISSSPEHVIPTMTLENKDVEIVVEQVSVPLDNIYSDNESVSSGEVLAFELNDESEGNNEHGNFGFAESTPIKVFSSNGHDAGIKYIHNHAQSPTNNEDSTYIEDTSYNFCNNPSVQQQWKPCSTTMQTISKLSNIDNTVDSHEETNSNSSSRSSNAGIFLLDDSDADSNADSEVRKRISFDGTSMFEENELKIKLSDTNVSDAEVSKTSVTTIEKKTLPTITDAFQTSEAFEKTSSDDIRSILPEIKPSVIKPTTSSGESDDIENKTEEFKDAIDEEMEHDSVGDVVFDITLDSEEDVNANLINSMSSYRFHSRLSRVSECSESSRASLQDISLEEPIVELDEDIVSDESIDEEQLEQLATKMTSNALLSVIKSLDDEFTQKKIHVTDDIDEGFESTDLDSFPTLTIPDFDPSDMDYGPKYKTSLHWIKHFDIVSMIANVEYKKKEYSNEVFAPQPLSNTPNDDEVCMLATYSDLCLFREDFLQQKTWEEKVKIHSRAKLIETKCDNQMWREEMLENFLTNINDADDEDDTPLPLSKQPKKKKIKQKMEISSGKKTRTKVKEQILFAAVSKLTSTKSTRQKLNIAEDEIKMTDKIKSTVNKLDDRRRSLDASISSHRLFKRKGSVNVEEDVFNQLQNRLDKSNNKPSAAAKATQNIKKLGKGVGNNIAKQILNATKSSDVDQSEEIDTKKINENSESTDKKKKFGRNIGNIGRKLRRKTIQVIGKDVEAASKSQNEVNEQNKPVAEVIDVNTQVQSSKEVNKGTSGSR